MIVALDQLRYKIAYKLADILAKTNITPNQVTLFRFVLAAPLSLYFFSRGTYIYNIVGLTIYVGLAILDWTDGRLATLKNKVSALGTFLDDTLEQILMFVVLGSLFYAGISSAQSFFWSKLIILFFTVHSFQTALFAQFDKMFYIDFDEYNELEGEIVAKGKLSFLDRLLLNILYVHRNSITKFAFCISYPLFVGILLNQLILTFVFITTMIAVRDVGIFFVMYRVVSDKKTHSSLISTLRQRLKKSTARFIEIPFFGTNVKFYL